LFLKTEKPSFLLSELRVQKQYDFNFRWQWRQ
jgi:hypothetical protein